MTAHSHARLAAQPTIQTLDIRSSKGALTGRQLLHGEAQPQCGGALRRRDDERVTGPQGRFQMGRKFQQRDPV